MNLFYSAKLIQFSNNCNMKDKNIHFFRKTSSILISRTSCSIRPWRPWKRRLRLMRSALSLDWPRNPWISSESSRRTAASTSWSRLSPPSNLSWERTGESCSFRYSFFQLFYKNNNSKITYWKIIQIAIIFLFQITSAEPLSNSHQQQISEALGKLTKSGQKLTVTYAVKPSIVGGLVSENSTLLKFSQLLFYRHLFIFSKRISSMFREYYDTIIIMSK